MLVASLAMRSGKPIVNFNPLNAIKVTDIVRRKDQSILDGNFRNQNIGIGDQLATKMKFRLEIRCADDDAVSNRQDFVVAKK